jgi:hypothetical protein
MPLGGWAEIGETARLVEKARRARRRVARRVAAVTARYYAAPVRRPRPRLY